jgi:hypothetical protein
MEMLKNKNIKSGSFNSVKCLRERSRRGEKSNKNYAMLNWSENFHEWENMNI